MSANQGTRLKVPIGSTISVAGQIPALLAELKTALEQTYGACLRGLYLYGSYARDQQDQESDLDVLIVLDQISRYSAEIKRTTYLVAELSAKYGVSVSRVFVPEPDWVHSDSPFLLNAREEAVAA